MNRLAIIVAAAAVAAGAGVLACDGGADPAPPDALPEAPGSSVATSLSPAQQAELDAIQAQLDAVKGLDAAGFAAKYAVPFTSALGYDPLAAKGLDLVQASPLALDAAEQGKLGANGFVITHRKRFPSFVYGYESIYSADLPVYVSADSILYAVHQSYDEILKTVETLKLIPALGRMLGAMRASLQAGAGSELSAEARRDADLYLAVAKSLLSGTPEGPVAGADAAAVKALVDGAVAHSGMQRITLFGAPRDVDFSQFTPRGHYTDTRELSRYFRAMMWLGRIDLRILETKPDHSQVFRRSQLEAAFVLRAATTPEALADFQTLDGTIGAFVGEPDNMTLPQLDGLLADLGLASAAELGQRSDAAIAQAIVSGGYGTQRIASHLMVNGLGAGTLPLSSTFLLLGQRYVLDSHVFSNVVYDRVQGGSVYRMMPDPLDVAFAALHNDQGGLLLGPQLTEYRYAPDLASMRILADAHPQAFWEGTLYNQWLASLRALSPTADVANPAAVGLPKVAATEPWGRRILSTQLASWAELRHDTILYAKQSYTAIDACEFPDAYVEPYPELFARVASFAARGAALALGGPIDAYFARLQSAAAILEAMAKNQRSGTAHTAEQLAFINQMTFDQGCGSLAGFDGWYAKLFFDENTALELDPVVADVHTQPSEPGGAIVGKVLHVGTGMPRLMVVTVDTCAGPRAYAGVASSYHEKVTENFQRLDDQQWKSAIISSPPPEVPWMTNLVVR